MRHYPPNVPSTGFTTFFTLFAVSICLAFAAGYIALAYATPVAYVPPPKPAVISEPSFRYCFQSRWDIWHNGNLRDTLACQAFLAERGA